MSADTLDDLDRLVRELESAREIASWYRSSPPFFDGPVRTERQGIAAEYEERVRVLDGRIERLMEDGP